MRNRFSKNLHVSTRYKLCSLAFLFVLSVAFLAGIIFALPDVITQHKKCSEIAKEQRRVISQSKLAKNEIAHLVSMMSANNVGHIVDSEEQIDQLLESIDVPYSMKKSEHDVNKQFKISERIIRFQDISLASFLEFCDQLDALSSKDIVLGNVVIRAIDNAQLDVSCSILKCVAI